MDKFNTERIEKLKCEFYKLIALLQMRKHIVISDIQLKCFEKTLSECATEDDAAAFIYGSIRRYKIPLEAGKTELLSCHSKFSFQFSIVQMQRGQQSWQKMTMESILQS